MQYAVAGDFASGTLEDRPVIFLLFGEHAREIITSDTAYWLGRVLAGACRGKRALTLILSRHHDAAHAERGRHFQENQNVERWCGECGPFTGAPLLSQSRSPSRVSHRAASQRPCAGRALCRARP